MNIQSISDTTVNLASDAYNAGKSAVVWAGITVQTGYARYILPATEKLHAVALSSLRLFGRLLEYGPGPLFAFATGIFLTGIAAFKLADQKAYEQNAAAKVIFKTIGIAAFLTATAAASCAIATLVVA